MGHFQTVSGQWCRLEMAIVRAARRPARAGPESPGPRALQAQTGQNTVFFIYKSFVQQKIQIFVNFLPVLLKIS